MSGQKSKMFLIKYPYWLGIVADALWAVGLFFPKVYGALTGAYDFNPDLQLRLVMCMAGTLMTGWTFLLLWAVRKPVERRFVAFLTAFPVVFGLSIVVLVDFLNGNEFIIWAFVKASIIFVSMVVSYILACKTAREKE